MHPVRLRLAHANVALVITVLAALGTKPAHAGNPIIRDRFTADPAAMVHGGRVYLYTGHDEAKPTDKTFRMYDWRCYSSDDMTNWKDEGSPLSVKAFRWARSSAWASQVVERDGKFYWYVCARQPDGFAICVAVGESPTGPFVDAIGKPLVTNDMTRGAIDRKNNREINWDDIDPTVFIDGDGQAHLYWGNTKCRRVKLKANMTELDGPIVDVDLPNFVEAPWLHKRGDTYYLSYAYEFPEKIAYATAASVTGPWTFRGIINDLLPNSDTNHQAIIEFKGEWWFFYHTAGLPGGGQFRRSVCVDRLFYEPDGSIRPIVRTADAVAATQPATQPSAPVAP